MTNNRRYNIERYTLEGEEVSELWIDSAQLVTILMNLKPEEDLVLHRVENAKPGVIYPL